MKRDPKLNPELSASSVRHVCGDHFDRRCFSECCEASYQAPVGTRPYFWSSIEQGGSSVQSSCTQILLLESSSAEECILCAEGVVL
ncbi:hypothetical protein AVEN_78850-1 [Araneus ventricosus]|uniref:THAP-type domain-containing protein n=1 Tax=Araneus ventricosus TaxID=182803 RepID=A0A4Y2NWW3_ARAVE|nr:hypothetical protein AVEN_78850-1 [Araneus ventricosus]